MLKRVKEIIVYQPGYSIACDPCDGIELYDSQDQPSSYLTAETDVTILTVQVRITKARIQGTAIVAAPRVVDERNMFIVDSMLKMS